MECFKVICSCIYTIVSSRTTGYDISESYSTVKLVVCMLVTTSTVFIQIKARVFISINDTILALFSRDDIFTNFTKKPREYNRE